MKSNTKYPEDKNAVPRVVIVGCNYEFVCLSFGEMGLAISPNTISKILDYFCSEIELMMHQNAVDGLISIVPGGYAWAVAVAGRSGLPLYTIRDNYPDDCQLPQIKQSSKLHERVLTIDPTASGMRLVYIDDVISSGSTIQSVFKLTQMVGANVIRSLFITARDQEVINALTQSEISVSVMLQWEAAKMEV
jgi:adenine/guanine phosphoribosyltransferase-like PRPP-binding protein